MLATVILSVSQVAFSKKGSYPEREEGQSLEKSTSFFLGLQVLAYLAKLTIPFLTYPFELIYNSGVNRNHFTMTISHLNIIDRNIF